MAEFGFILQAIVIGAFIIYSYSKIKGQSIKETIDELMDFINKFKNE